MSNTDLELCRRYHKRKPTLELSKLEVDQHAHRQAVRIAEVLFLSRSRGSAYSRAANFIATAERNEAKFERFRSGKLAEFKNLGEFAGFENLSKQAARLGVGEDIEASVLPERLDIETEFSEVYIGVKPAVIGWRVLIRNQWQECVQDCSRSWSSGQSFSALVRSIVDLPALQNIHLPNAAASIYFQSK